MDPVLRRQVATAILDECRIAGMDPYFVLAVMEVESDFQPEAVSSRDAHGLMQLRDVTVREVKRLEGLPEESGTEPEDVISVRVGIRYLSHLHRMFGNRAVALAAWNAGPGAVRRELSESGKVPDRWLAFSRQVLREHRRLLAQLGPDRPDSYAAAAAAPAPTAQD
jgi:soluble lytic murein transglycosylase-like protein